MAITVKRSDIWFLPDPSRIIARFVIPEDRQQAMVLIKKVLSMPDDEVNKVFNQVLRNFSQRHRNITRIFEKHFEVLKNILTGWENPPETLPLKHKLLIAAYFTREYSIEGAAFYNPCIVEDPDQLNLDGEGKKRVVISFRTIGEGHISSLVFRSGIIDKENRIEVESPGPLLDVAESVKRHVYEKRDFLKKLQEMQIPPDVIGSVLSRLKDTFIYGELQAAIESCTEDAQLPFGQKTALESINWVAISHYGITFSLDTAISERVIFPVSYAERNGIEDARFVRFTDDDGEVTYYATYTAHNGFALLPKLLETKDFYHFKISPIHGECAQHRGMALFPRKIGGQYAMVSSYDEVNKYVMYSDDVKLWRNAARIEEPEHPWEFVRIGNCGSPLETEKGWLLLTYGVGPMRRCCLGAVLLDLEDPTRVIAHLKEPLMVPNESERVGYVPNVLFSCGSIIHNNELIIPYSMSGASSAFATVPLDELWEELLGESSGGARTQEAPKRPAILVVDDEPIIRKFVAQLLSSEGYDVEIATDGAEALISIGGKQFDLIIMDLNMPTLDGFQLMKIIKKRNIDTPVIVLSGDEQHDLEEKGLDLSTVEFVSKPVNAFDLMLKVAPMLEKRKQ